MRGYEGEESKVDERILDGRKGTRYEKEDRKEKEKQEMRKSRCVDIK